MVSTTHVPVYTVNRCRPALLGLVTSRPSSEQGSTTLGRAAGKRAAAQIKSDWPCFGELQGCCLEALVQLN